MDNSRGLLRSTHTHTTIARRQLRVPRSPPLHLELICPVLPLITCLQGRAGSLVHIVVGAHVQVVLLHVRAVGAAALTLVCVLGCTMARI